MLKNVKSWLPGLIISVIFIGLIVAFVDVRQLVDAIRQANVFWLVVNFVGNPTGGSPGSAIVPLGMLPPRLMT